MELPDFIFCDSFWLLVEYLRLVEKIHNKGFHPYIKIGLIVMGYGLLIGLCGPTFQLNGYGIKENLCLPVSVAGFAILL
jgi:hypothetical protein